jgi:heat-inducible transcriptional repressor
MVLRAIVAAYVAEAMPASSATVSHLIPVSLSTASIRATMSDLAELGLIEKPHASSGRLPTELGLRLFVDELLDTTELAEYERRSLVSECEEVSTAGVVGWISTLLSEKTHQLGFVMSPRVDRMAMRHISFVRVSTDKVLAVLVPEAGPIQQRWIEEEGAHDQAELDAFAARLNERLPGRTLSELRVLLERELRELRYRARNALAEALALGVRALAAPFPDEMGLVIARRSAFLNQPEFDDPDRIRGILEAVETKERLLEVIEQILDDPRDMVTVSLGEELEEPGLRQCAMVAVPYWKTGHSEFGAHAGEDLPADQALGVLGVIGPSRMDYRRVIPLVGFCSHLVTRKLTPSTETTPAWR